MRFTRLLLLAQQFSAEKEGEAESCTMQQPCALQSETLPPVHVYSHTQFAMTSYNLL